MPEPGNPIRVLLLADSHLGFDLPTRPRIDRRRRGHDFLANYERALAPARAGDVDLVVHGGDVFHRPRVPASLAFQALEPLREIAETGVPVFVVPGNHERSRIPHDRFATHPCLHLFSAPGTRTIDLRGIRVAVSGFPYQRRGIRRHFPEILRATGWRRQGADVRLLCMHHCVEGAQVGQGDFTFRNAPDVIRCADLPPHFAAVLSGHIHRHQILRRDLVGIPLPTPVLYPGSLERTAFAEMGEVKGFMLLAVDPAPPNGRLSTSRLVPLPDRTMMIRRVGSGDEPGPSWSGRSLRAALMRAITGAPPDAVLRIHIQGPFPPSLRHMVSAGNLRRIAPPEMNVEVILDEDAPRSFYDRRRRKEAASGPSGGSNVADRSPVQIGLDFQGSVSHDLPVSEARAFP